MKTFQLQKLLAQREQSQRPWLEFLRADSLSMGVYHLKAGQADLQQPHQEDEVYFVVTGRARFQAAGSTQAVEPGAVLFVERTVAHRFMDITEDLTVLVFFAPPEGSQQPSPG